MKVFSAEQMYEADSCTAEKQNISSLDLMERAGNQIFNWLDQRMQGAQVPIHIFCGIGNNGGDGLVLGRILIEHGYKVITYVANFTDKRSKCFLTNYDRIKKVSRNWPVLMKGEEDFPEIHPDDIIIDALFGIGLNRPPEGWVKKLIQYLNAQKSFRLAIDIPSGLYANKAIEDREAVILANHTLTFQVPKLAFFLPETGMYVPFYEALDIGLDQEYLHTVEPLAQLISKQEAKLFYKQRKKYDHKGMYGHSLIIGGSYGKIGAVLLAATSALRSGGGLVTIFAPKCGYTALQTALPEAMVISDDNPDVITQIDIDFQPTVVCVGMGMGTDKTTVESLEKLLTETKSPMVIDADALNCIAAHADLLKLIPENSVLTPHPGELERLVGSWTDDYDKLEKATKFSKDHKVIIIIKGANTITLFEGKMYINTTGNPGMATAGSGDVLAGVIAGLMSQGYDPLLASIFGVYLHGSAGNIASSKMGYEAMIATDIISDLGNSFLELFRQEQPPSEEKNQ